MPTSVSDFGYEVVRTWEYLLEPTQWIVEDPIARRTDILKDVIDDVYNGILAITSPVIDRAASVLLVDSRLYKADQMVKSMKPTLRRWAQAIADIEDPTGAATARTVLDVAFGDRIPEEFWLTKLGQLLFFRDGFPDRPVSRAEAGFILGGITRQAVHDMHRGRAPHRLISEEKSADAADRDTRYVTRDSMYRRWGESRRVQREQLLLIAARPRSVSAA